MTDIAEIVESIQKTNSDIKEMRSLVSSFMSKLDETTRTVKSLESSLEKITKTHSDPVHSLNRDVIDVNPLVDALQADKRTDYTPGSSKKKSTRRPADDSSEKATSIRKSPAVETSGYINW